LAHGWHCATRLELAGWRLLRSEQRDVGACTARGRARDV
jgi:hypothetical protein